MAMQFNFVGRNSFGARQLLIGFGPGYFIPGVNEYDFFASSDLMKRFPALILDGSVIFLG
jgi:hypothetical protein